MRNTGEYFSNINLSFCQLSYCQQGVQQNLTMFAHISLLIFKHMCKFCSRKPCKYVLDAIMVLEC